ncbi:MAG: hypothetical protein AABY74_01655 [Planctomycetota bacterium]
MIHEVEGDILLTRAQVIAHGVAANDAITVILFSISCTLKQ